MIHWMLSRLEQDPAAAFYEQELRSRFPEEFEEVKSQGLLSSVTDSHRSYGYNLSRTRVVVETDDGQFEAWDEDNTDEEPLVLTGTDLAKWRLSLGAIIRRLHEENGLEGSLEELNERLTFVGETSLGDRWLGVVLGFLDDRCALPLLRELPNRLARNRYTRTLIVCPAFAPQPSVRREIESLALFVVPYPTEGFEVDLRQGNEPATDSQPRFDFRHSGDYSSVTRNGRSFPLVTRQAAVVKRLHQAYKRELFDVSWRELKEIARRADGSAPEKMGDVFKGVDGWRSLITFERKGFWRLNF